VGGLAALAVKAEERGSFEASRLATGLGLRGCKAAQSRRRELAPGMGSELLRNDFSYRLACKGNSAKNRGVANSPGKESMMALGINGVICSMALTCSIAMFG
jgi:hypothetical protein